MISAFLIIFASCRGTIESWRAQTAIVSKKRYGILNRARERVVFTHIGCWNDRTESPFRTNTSFPAAAMISILYHAVVQICDIQFDNELLKILKAPGVKNQNFDSLYIARLYANGPAPPNWKLSLHILHDLLSANIIPYSYIKTILRWILITITTTGKRIFVIGCTMSIKRATVSCPRDDLENNDAGNRYIPYVGVIEIKK